jgi:hypothetical protein
MFVMRQYFASPKCVRMHFMMENEKIKELDILKLSISDAI